MKTQKLNQVRLVIIIEAFTDYLEHACEERGGSNDAMLIVNEFFDKFVDWAFDDFIINNEEREFLQSTYKWELRERIKKEVIYGLIAA